MRKIKVAALQLSGAVKREPETAEKDKAQVVERLLRLIKDASKERVNIACTTELSLTPFFCPKLIRDHDYLFDELPSPFIEPLTEEAKKNDMALIISYAERDGIKQYNSAIVFDTDGTVLGKYRKVHIPAYFPSDITGATGTYERLYFTPGDLGFPVFDLKDLGAKIGIQICYERMYPEGCRILGLKGIDILFNPTNSATYGESYRHEALAIFPQSRAYENGYFVCLPNKAGTEGDRVNVGRSMIVSPKGGKILVMGSPDKEEVVTAEIDLDEALEGRKRVPYWRDRRPSQYAKLLEQ